MKQRIPAEGQGPATLREHRELHRKLAAPPDPGVRVKPATFGGVGAELVWDESAVGAFGAGVAGVGGLGGDLAAGHVILYAHGGGFEVGHLPAYRQFAGRLSRASGAQVIVVDYRLAPEHTFPAALDDMVAAYRALPWQPDRIVIGGDSLGGGTLALATLVAVRDRPPAAAFALSPFTDLTLSSPSMTDPESPDPFGRIEQFRHIAEQYAPGGAADPRVSPVFADYNGLPPLHIEVGGAERLLDDARRVAERARAAGVTVTLEIADGVPHDVAVGAPDTPEAAAVLARVGAFVRLHAGC